MDELVITTAGLLDLLSKIEELKDLNLGLTETLDGDIQLQVGDSTYIIDTSKVDEIPVSEETIDKVSEVNEEAFNNLDESGTTEILEPVESGLIGELAKTLFVGGVARLTAHILKK